MDEEEAATISHDPIWAPDIENDGSEFFEACAGFREVSALDVAGGLRAFAEKRLESANEDLKAGADAIKRLQMRDSEGKPSFNILKESITRDDNKDGLMRLPGGLVYGFAGAVCFMVFWAIVGTQKHLPVAVAALDENVITPTRAKLRPIILNAKMKLDEAAERHQVPGWKKMSAAEEEEYDATAEPEHPVTADDEELEL